MADSDPKSVRPFGQNSIRRASDADEDPLVELARIVSEDSGFHGARDRVKPHRDGPVDRNAVSADLEAELLQELETSFASRNPSARPAGQAAQPVAPRQPAARPAPQAVAPPARAPGAPNARDKQAEQGPSDDSDDLLRSIEEQLGQFERRAQVGRPSAVERPETGGERRDPRRAAESAAPVDRQRAAPPRGAEPARVTARGNAPDASRAPGPVRNVEAPAGAGAAEQGIDDAPESVLRPLADVRDGGAGRAERGDRPARAAPPSQQVPRAVRPNVEAAEQRRPADRPADSRPPLRRRDEPAALREASAAPVRRQDTDVPVRPAAATAGSIAAGWEQIGDEESKGRSAAPDVQDWDAPVVDSYRPEPATTFGHLDDAAAGSGRFGSEDGAIERRDAEIAHAGSGNASRWDDSRIGDDAHDDRPRVVVAATGDGGPPQFGRGSRSRGGGRKALLAGVGVLAVLLIGGAAALTFLRGANEAPSGPPPVIAATGGDVKVEAPPQEQPTEGETVGEAVYNRVAGTAPDAQEQVVDGAEEPREIARIVLPPPQAEADQALVRPVGDEAGAAAAGAAAADTAAADPDEIGLRRVRTYVVRPDGTIAATDAAAAPPPKRAEPQQVAAAAPMEPVSVPTVAISDGEAAADPAAASPAAEPAAEVAAEPAEDTQPEPDSSDASEADGSADLAVAAPDVVANAPVDLLSGDPASAPATAPDGFVVQISSQRSLADARSSFEAMRRRFPSVLGELDPDIKEADLGAKGVYYRVRVGPFASRADAIGVCETLQAAGGSCFVTR